MRTALERAYELAATGMGIRDIRYTLMTEGLDPNQIYGREIIRQLQLCARAVRCKSPAQTT